MTDAPLWHWQVRFVNSQIHGLYANPVDYSRHSHDNAVASMWVNHEGACCVDVEVIAKNRADAERTAHETFDRVVPEDMRGMRR